MHTSSSCLCVFLFRWMRCCIVEIKTNTDEWTCDGVRFSYSSQECWKSSRHNGLSQSHKNMNTQRVSKVIKNGHCLSGRPLGALTRVCTCAYSRVCIVVTRVHGDWHACTRMSRGLCGRVHAFCACEYSCMHACVHAYASARTCVHGYVHVHVQSLQEVSRCVCRYVFQRNFFAANLFCLRNLGETNCRANMRQQPGPPNNARPSINIT